MKRLQILAILVAFLGFGAAGVHAATTPQITQELDLRGYFIDSDAEGNINELESFVADQPDEAPIYVVSLGENPSNGADGLADELRRSVDIRGTVLVISPSEIGASSDIHDDASVDLAVDAALNGLSDSFMDGVAAFASALGDSSEVSGEGSEEDAGGGAGLLIFLLIVVVLIGVVIYFVKKGNKKRTGDARQELTEELSELSADILSLSDEVELANNDKATEHYRTGNAEFVELSERITVATTATEFDSIDFDLDIAAWHLDAAEALLRGRQVPSKPLPAPPPPPPVPSAKTSEPAPEPNRTKPPVPTTSPSEHREQSSTDLLNELGIPADSGKRVQRRATHRQKSGGRAGAKMVGGVAGGMAMSKMLRRKRGTTPSKSKAPKKTSRTNKAKGRARRSRE